MILKRIKAGHIIKAETNQREDEKARGDSPKSIANEFERLRSIKQEEVLVGNAGYPFR
jgi:hypothetical protein